MTVNINQFKLLFLVSWVVLYLIYPSWALPVSLDARVSVFIGLIIYFSLYAAVMNRAFNLLEVDKQVIMTVNRSAVFRDNIWLIVIITAAAALHLYPISLPMLIIGDETVHLQNGLWLYEFIESSSQPMVQVSFWLAAGLLVFIMRKHAIGRMVQNWACRPRIFIAITLSAAFLMAYFLLMRNMPHFTGLVRYPPLSKMIYLIAYSGFGISHIFPRLIQLIFYLLCAVYIYRTIGLYHEKQAALLGATIYLFLPVAFAYAYLGELASGTICFIVIISFYFLRFVKEGDNRDLLLASYFIGLGFLYKKPVIIMFIVCFSFFVIQRIRRRDFPSLLHFVILMLSVVPVIPWMVISKLYSWRNYTFIPAHLTAFDDRIIPYLQLIQSNISIIISVLFVLSAICFVLFKRDALKLFFGLILIFYLFFVISDMAAPSPRFAMTFYPTISVYVTVFLAGIMRRVKWRHAFNVAAVLLSLYLIVICTVTPLNRRFLAVMEMKMHYFPTEQAMKWVKENVRDDEKILNIRILTASFYSIKFGIDSEKIINYFYSVEPFSTPEKLKAFYKENGLSYIMFPYSPAYVRDNVRMGILKYLEKNPSSEYMEVAEFNLNGNAIHIYKLREE